MPNLFRQASPTELSLILLDRRSLVTSTEFLERTGDRASEVRIEYRNGIKHNAGYRQVFVSERVDLVRGERLRW